MIRPISKKKIILIGSGILIIILVSLKLTIWKKDAIPIYEFILAQRSDLVQEVSLTGTVVPKESADMAFEIGGKIKEVFVDVGGSTTEGQVLLKLDDKELQAQLSQARAQTETVHAEIKQAQASLTGTYALLDQYQAALDREESKLDELKTGARSEEIQISETQVNNAQQDLYDAKTNLSNVETKAASDITALYADVLEIINDAYTKADDAINKQTIDLFDKNNTTYELSFSTSDVQTKNEVERRRPGIGLEIDEWQTEIDQLSNNASNSDLDTALEQAHNHLVNFRDFLVTLMEALTNAINTASASTATLNTYRGYVITSRNNINTELSTIKTQQQSIASRKVTNQNNIDAAQTTINQKENALNLAQEELALLVADARPETIAVQEASVRSAEANIANQLSQIDQAQAALMGKQAALKQAQANTQKIQASLDKTSLIAPIAGLVSRQDAKKGEIISPNTILVSIINLDAFEIEMFIPEADIAKVKINDTAIVTLDAYGDDVKFSATVTFIDPAETNIDGVATYKTTLLFKEKDKRIKSGMTADTDILTAQRPNVIAIPQRAVIRKNGDKIVRLVARDEYGRDSIQEVIVKTGVRGSDGNIEIIAGIEEGYKIIVYMESK